MFFLMERHSIMKNKKSVVQTTLLCILLWSSLISSLAKVPMPLGMSWNSVTGIFKVLTSHEKIILVHESPENIVVWSCGVVE